MSVTAAGENAGNLHKAGCAAPPMAAQPMAAPPMAAPPMAAPPMAAPPALCPRHDYSEHVIVGEFTFVKQSEQINVSWPVGGGCPESELRST